MKIYYKIATGYSPSIALAAAGEIGLANAAEIAADRMDNLAGQVEEVGGKLETFQIQLFDTQAGALSDFADCIGYIRPFKFVFCRDKSISAKYK